MATLYRKWRPQQFKQVVGQDHIVKTLKNALQAQAVGHSYLFTGPRGTGKTTVARILAKTINCTATKDGEACGKCEVCRQVDGGSFLDIIEVDGASNRGIDEIRELRDKVRFKPNIGVKKVYIIDEVHMLTKEAFNALLKTLEEPPAHVMFIFATTEPHKLPQTIISRTQRFDFRLANEDALYEHLLQIVEQEGYQGEQQALKTIARLADGSFRDALSLLEQVLHISDKKIIFKEIQQHLGLAGLDLYERLLDHWSQANSAGVLGVIDEAERSGADFGVLIKELTRATHDLLIVKSANSELTLNRLPDTASATKIAARVSTPVIIDLLGALIEQSANVRQSPIAKLPIEIALFSTMPIQVQSSTALPKTEVNDVVPLVDSVESPSVPIVEQAPSEVKTVPVSDEKLANAFLEAAKPLNHSIYASLKVSRIDRKDRMIEVTCPYAFHIEQLNKRAAKAILQGLAKQFECDDVKFVHVPAKTKKASTQDGAELYEQAKEIFR